MKIERTPEEITKIKGEIESGTVTDPDLKAFLDELGVTRVLNTTTEERYKGNLENAWAARTDRSNYSAIDAKIAELTGITLNTNEKTLDYATRALGEMKTREGKPNEAAAREIETLKAQVKAKETEVDTARKEGQAAMIQERARLESTSAVEALKAQFPEMGEQALKDIVEVRLNRFLKENVPAADDKGNLVYTDPANGNARRLNAATNNEPFKTADLLAPYFADLKKADAPAGSPPAGGAGAGAGKAGEQGKGAPGAPKPAAASDKGIKGLGARPEGIKTQVDAWNKLKELGHTNATEGFNDTYKSWITNDDGSELPEA